MSLKAILYLIFFLVGCIKTINAPVYGIVTYVVMSLLRPETFSYMALAKYNLYVIAFAVLVIATIINGNINREFWRHRSPIILLLSLMVFFNFISGMWAIFPSESFKFTIEILKTILFCIFMVGLVNNENDFNKLIASFVVGVGFLAIWGFQQHFRGNVRLEDIGGGVSAESNALAMLFVVFLPFFLMASTRGPLTFRWLSVSLIPFVVADVIFTQSRSAFAGLLATLVYIFFKYKTSLIKKIWLATIGVIILIFAGQSTSLNDVSYFDRIYNLYERGMEVDNSASSRKMLWKAAVEIFKDNPVIGVGIQHYKYHVAQYTDGRVSLADAHSTFLLTLAEGGVLGFICYALSFFYSFLGLSQVKKNVGTLNKNIYNSVILIESSLIGFLIAAISHSYTQNELIYWMLTLPIILNKIYGCNHENKYFVFDKKIIAIK